MSRNLPDDDGSGKPFKWAWLDKIESDDGPDDSTLRHVLVAMRRHMDRHGGPARISQPQLAEYTGRSESTVRRKLQEADGVWIVAFPEPGRRTVFYPILGPVEREFSTEPDNVENSPRNTDRTPVTVRGVGLEPPSLCRGSPVSVKGVILSRVSRESVSLERGRGREAGVDPRAAPGSEDGQLPLTGMLLQAVRSGDKTAFDEVSQELRQDVERESG